VPSSWSCSRGSSPAAHEGRDTSGSSACERKASEALVVGADGGVRGSAILIEGVARGKKAGGESVLDNAKCLFVSHVTALAPGMRVRIRNSDPILHNTHGALRRAADGDEGSDHRPDGGGAAGLRAALIPAAGPPTRGGAGLPRSGRRPARRRRAGARRGPGASTGTAGRAWPARRAAGPRRPVPSGSGRAGAR